VNNDQSSRERDWLTLWLYIVHDYSVPHETSQLERSPHLLGCLLVSRVLIAFLLSKLISEKARKPRRHALLRHYYLWLWWCIRRDSSVSLAFCVATGLCSLLLEPLTHYCQQISDSCNKHRHPESCKSSMASDLPTSHWRQLARLLRCLLFYPRP